RLPCAEGAGAPEARRREAGLPAELAAADTPRPIDDADGGEPLELGARPELRGALRQAALHSRQLGVAELAWRPEPDAHQSGALYAHGRDDLQALLRWPRLREERTHDAVDRPPDDARGAAAEAVA